jgi:hypothetical protein
MKLKIFSDRSYLPEEMWPTPILFPFWDVSLRHESSFPWDRRLERYAERGKAVFEMTSLEEADLAIMPMSWEEIRGHSWRTTRCNEAAQDLAIRFAKKVEQAGKPLVVFFLGDVSDEELPVNSAFTFRASSYRSTKKTNDFVIPAWSEDFVESYLGGQIAIRQKQAKPVVGFCGLVEKNQLKMKLKTVVYQATMLTRQGKLGVSPYKGHSLRFQAMSTLSKSLMTDTNFVERERMLFIGKPVTTETQKTRREFVQNMVESDYVLCCRGIGNYSFRFYETLCCGRIPVFIDTDCVLPYDFGIDWKKYCVWVDENELPFLAEKIAEFHSSLSVSEFVDLQYECRKLYEQWLSPEGFFCNFYRHFKLEQVQPI